MTSFAFADGTHSHQVLGINNSVPDVYQTGILGRAASIVTDTFSNPGIWASNNFDLRVDGQILVSNNNGVRADALLGHILIGSTGLIQAASTDPNTGSAIFSSASDELFIQTAGQLYGANGIYINSEDGQTTTIENSGLIQGWTAGVRANGLGTVEVENTGTISGGEYGFLFSFVDFQGFMRSFSPLTLTNAGTISGSQAAIKASTPADTVINEGLIRGNVFLGGGFDRYDGSEGRTKGVVYGEDGDDIFVAGDYKDTFVAGIGNDLLDFRGTSGVTLALDATSLNTGVADGDLYTGFERIFGSQRGKDTLLGDSYNNQLFGFFGADSLSGGIGNDLLSGGGNIDNLLGGSGNDTFAFEKSSYGGDLISDFSNSANNNDAFRITASGFGGGLSLGVLAAGQFRSRADHVAQDAGDRFIFDTTDNTLWFDVDGKGGSGPVLIADLQASAVVTSADILIV